MLRREDANYLNYAAFLKKQQALLEARLAECRENQKRVKTAIQVDLDEIHDEVDLAVALHDQRLNLESLTSNNRVMAQVVEALKAINNGKYGICWECDGEIGQKRLEAIPWACCCVTCQEQRDSKRAA